MKEIVNTDNFELHANDAYERRCAEIFITQKRGFILHCSLCNCKYRDYKKFMEHALTQHYHEEKKNEMEDEAYSENLYAVEKLLEEHQQQVQVAAEFNTEERRKTITIDIKVDEECEEYELFEVQVEAGKTESAEQSSLETEQMEEETIDIVPVYETEYDSKNTSLDEPTHRKTAAFSLSRSSIRAKSVAENSQLFIGNEALKSHTKTSFNQTRKFQCEHCGFAFKEGYNLRAHLRRHTSLKQFSCAQCPKKFHTRSELSTHERRHTGERPFVCPLCNMSFITSGALCEHMKRHTNNRTHKCEFCKKCFYDTFQLKEHLVVHTQERNHICNTCNAAFSRHKSLVVHMKLHANERQYICDICKMAFNQKQALTSHFKSKHKQNSTFTDEIEEKKSCDIVSIMTSREKREIAYKDSLIIEEVHEDDSTDLFV